MSTRNHTLYVGVTDVKCHLYCDDIYYCSIDDTLVEIEIPSGRHIITFKAHDNESDYVHCEHREIDAKPGGHSVIVIKDMQNKIMLHRPVTLSKSLLEGLSEMSYQLQKEWELKHGW